MYRYISPRNHKDS
uniref:Uncharacterized protein n=1 Tax=Anguilla anguilla TaxID=7936 RepID=A0A0E9UKK9_ANGAN